MDGGPVVSQRRQTFEVLSLSALFLAITAFTVIGFSRDWAPPVASRHGEGVDAVIRYLEATTGAILIIGTLALVAFLWLYGRGKPTASPATNERSERRWSIIPVLGMALVAEAGVMFKGLPVWKEVYATPGDDAVVVELVAQQFEWLVRYPGPDGRLGRMNPIFIEPAGNPLGLDSTDAAARDDIVLRNRVRVPVGRSVAVHLRSRDVLHSFSVPAFRVKQDVVPGIVTRVQFVPTVAGSYEIACAELCGMAHYRMAARVIVQEPAEFATWMAEQKGVFQQ
jgi:cytochrome c oxidase subunit 2